MYYRADAGMLVKSSIGVLESRVTFAALAVVVFIVDSRGATRALSGAMFGRFGRGGGNFVAQYRVYPVSFVDKVRLLPSPARAVPQSRHRHPSTQPRRSRVFSRRIWSVRSSRRRADSVHAPRDVPIVTQNEAENGDKSESPPRRSLRARSADSRALRSPLQNIRRISRR